MRASEEVASKIKHDEILRRCDNNELLLKQISKSEISGLVEFVLGSESQNRLRDLPLGVCTRFDKRTLKASNRPAAEMTLSFDTFYRQKPQIPRTIIAMRETETVTVAYILLGSKLADAYSIDEFRASKDKDLKINGGFKQKTNVLKISISEDLDQIDVSLRAILKVKKKVKNYLYWLKMSLYSAKVQHTLAQKCSEILDCTPLVLDNTFTDRNLYIVSELGVELFDIIVNDRLIEPQEQQMTAKDICRAICFLHSLRISHRDIKLENLIVVNSSKRPKFIDFDFTYESGKSNFVSGTIDYMPYYFLGAPQDRKVKTSPYNVSSLVLNESEKIALYNACCSGASFCDIWAFGLVLYVIYTKGCDIGTFAGKRLLDSFKGSTKTIEQVIYQILCPARENCYLMATTKQLEEDMDKPLSERIYLSIEKVYHMLFAEEYKLDEDIVKDLKPRMRELFATRPNLNNC